MNDGFILTSLPMLDTFQSGLESIGVMHVFLFICIVIVEVYSRIVIRKWKKQFDFGSDEDGIDEEQYTEYYKRFQLLYILRIAVIAIFLVFLLMGFSSVSFGYFAIAAGAITLVFSTYIQSFVTYFYLLSILSVGQTVKIGNWQGNIIRIRPLYISIACRSDNGEHTGELVNIPNYKVWDNPIVNVDLSLGDYKKAIIKITYKHDQWRLSFDEFLEKLEEYLSENFPKATGKAVNHFKTYRGHAYKLGFDYNDDGHVEIRVGFICQLREVFPRKRQVISFLESFRQGTEEK